MRSLYARWMYGWEDRLCSVSTDRVVRPFEWGLDWAESWPHGLVRNGHTPHEYLTEVNQAILADSDRFFDYEKPTDFELKDRLLTFTSPVRTPYPENNRATGVWFPVEEKPGKKPRRKVAAIVLPHWNASLGQHGALCAGLAKLGIAAMRMSLPYHDYRMPAELKRADYAVSSNIARTIDATRQAVIDVRCHADWLQSQGYESIGVVGTSLGSAYAFLASVHDPRLKVNVFNHCSTYFADVVWEGLSTKHVKAGLEGNVTLDQLRDVWQAISPPYYFDRFAVAGKKPLFMYATYDTTFPTRFSEQVISSLVERKVPHKKVVLPCGHYTLGESPFKFMAGYHIVSFLKRNL